MEKIQKKYDVGVLVARLQVDELHEGHIQLIDHVCANHARSIIFLGLSPCGCTLANPLDFEARKKMLFDKYPDTLVLYIKDVHDDTLWSKHLDEQIEDVIGPNQTVCLYGSRDSFISHYHGKYDCVEMEQTVFTSGKEIRKRIANFTKDSADFRHGVIWATQNQYPAMIPTVDLAIFNEEGNRILLARKPKETKYRFVGGFVMPGETLEHAAQREGREETSLEIQEVQYFRSFVVDDWRYRSEMDKITTSLFVTKKVFGKPQANDDVAELRWFDYNLSVLGHIVDEHHDMMLELIKR